MNPLITNLRLVKYEHEYFPGVDSSSNDVMLSRMSHYIFKTIRIQSVLNYKYDFSQTLCLILIHF